MKKIFTYIFLLFFFSLPLSANLVFDAEGEYMITCYDAKKGGVIPSLEGSYSLIYEENATIGTGKAFWIIKEEEPGKYSFRNSVTNQYIKYAPDNRDSRYLVMCDELVEDSTLFTFSPKELDRKLYYVIISVSDPSQFFNKRSSGAVGTYPGTYSNNELFYFREKNELFEGGTGSLFNYLDYFKMNEKEIIPSHEGIYYFSISSAILPQANQSLNLSFSLKKSGYQIKINGKEVIDGENFIFENSTATSGHKIDIYENNKIIASEKLIITSLPIVQLYSEGNSLSSNFSRSKIRVYEGDKDFSQTGELLNAEMRYRGASALGYAKKSFAIKLRDDNWESIDRSFFGLRDDNYWVLDAMAVDQGRIRNRMATDLWNDFSSEPYYKSKENEMVNGTKGQFVEVFLDDEYWGLYCMTERIDRKQLKLKKYQDETENIRGVLYKSDQWSYAVLMGYEPWRGPNPLYELSMFDNGRERWDNYEVKYPELEDGQKIDWEPLYDVVNMVAKGDDYAFRNYISNDVDLPVWTDYYLFLELILATDNHGKNAYFSMYNITNERKLLITPWDLDGTFGRRWNGNKVSASADFSEFIAAHENGEHYLYYRLKKNNLKNFNDTLKARYDRLRFTWFSEESLVNRVQEYMDLFQNSGAAARETARWNGADFTYEENYLKEWIGERVAYLNEQYGEPIIKPNPVNMETIESQIQVYPNPVVEWLYIRNVDLDTPVWVYTENGICIYNSKVNNSSYAIDFSTFASGRYFLKVGKQGKVIIKNH